METQGAPGTIDYRLLGLLSNLVICSSCLRSGRVTPVPQIVSERHTPRSLCSACAKPRHRNLHSVLRRLIPA